MDNAELITEYIDLQATGRQTEALLAQINSVAKALKDTNSIKVNLDGAKTFRQAAEVAGQLKTTTEQLVSSQQKLNGQESQAAKSARTTADAYGLLNQAYKESERHAKNMAVLHGSESEEALKAAEAAAELRKQLQQADAAAKGKTVKSQTTTENTKTNNIEFTTNLDELEAERQATLKTGEAVSQLEKEQAAAAIAATEWGNAQKAAGEAVQGSFDGDAEEIKTVRLELDKYTGSLRENIAAQLDTKSALANNKAQQKEIEKAMADSGGASDSQISKLTALKEQEVILNEQIKSISVTIRNQAKDFNSTEGSMDSLQAKVNLLQHAYEQLGATEQQSDFGKEIKAQIDALEPSIKAQEGSIGRHSRNVGNYSSAVKTLEKALQDVRSRMDDYNKSGETSETILASLVREESLLSELVETQVHGFQNATTEVRNNEKALQALQVAGLQNTAFYKELLQETADLKDNVSDLKTQIKNLGSDTRTLDGLIDSAQALTGVYGVAQGAAALFGKENEELEQTFVKLQAVQTILSGLQSLQNFLQKESAGLTLLNTIRTNALALAQRAYAFATSGATTAARTFNTVLLTSGIGAILLLLPLAASAMSELGDETDDTAKSTEELNKELDETDNKLQKVAESAEKLRNAGKGGINELRRQLNVLEASGGSDEAVYNKRKQIIESEIHNLKVLQETYVEDGQKRAEIGEQIKDKENDLLVERLKLNKKYADDRKKDAEQGAEKSKEALERELKAQFELQKYYRQREIEDLKTLGNNEESPFADRVRVLQETLQKEEESINAQRNFDLHNEKLAQSERKLINVKADDEITQKYQEFASTVITIRQHIADKEKQLIADTTAFVQGEIDKQTKARVGKADTSYSNRLQGIKDTANAELQIEQDRFAKGEVNAEEYNAKKSNIESRANSASLQAAILHQQELLKITDLPVEQREKAIADLQELENQRRAADLQQEEEYLNKKAGLQEAYNEKLKSLALQVYDTIGKVVENQFENQSSKVDAQMELLDERKNKEIEVANQAILSANERERAIKEIEVRAVADKDALEKKKRNIEAQRARVEKVSSIARIAIETAMDVFKIQAQAAVLASNPLTLPLAGLALAQIPLVIGSGALAAGLIASQKIPQYKTGKNTGDFNRDSYSGPSLVGDGYKSELIIKENGEMIVTPNKPTLVYVGEKDIIMPDAKKALSEIHDDSMVNNVTNYLTTDRLYNINQRALQTQIDRQSNIATNESLREEVRSMAATKLFLLKQELKELQQEYQAKEVKPTPAQVASDRLHTQLSEIKTESKNLLSEQRGRFQNGVINKAAYQEKQKLIEGHYKENVINAQIEYYNTLLRTKDLNQSKRSEAYTKVLDLEMRKRAVQAMNVLRLQQAAVPKVKETLFSSAVRETSQQPGTNILKEGNFDVEKLDKSVNRGFSELGTIIKNKKENHFHFADRGKRLVHSGKSWQEFLNS